MFRSYANFSRSIFFRGDPHFRSTVSLLSPDIKEAPILDIRNAVVYANEPKRNHALRLVTSEWVNRTVKRQESIRNSGIDFNNLRDKANLIRSLGISIFPPTTQIVNELRGISVEDGLEFLALVGAHWSYRFSTAGFMKYFRKTEWPILDWYHINDFIAQSSIMFIACGWQVEYLVPIYWELIKSRQKAT